MRACTRMRNRAFAPRAFVDPRRIFRQVLDEDGDTPPLLSPIDAPPPFGLKYRLGAGITLYLVLVQYVFWGFLLARRRRRRDHHHHRTRARDTQTPPAAQDHRTHRFPPPRSSDWAAVRSHNPLPRRTQFHPRAPAVTSRQQAALIALPNVIANGNGGVLTDIGLGSLGTTYSLGNRLPWSVRFWPTQFLDVAYSLVLMAGTPRAAFPDQTTAQ